MKKRIALLLLALVLVCSMTGCGAAKKLLASLASQEASTEEESTEEESTEEESTEEESTEEESTEEESTEEESTEEESTEEKSEKPAAKSTGIDTLSDDIYSFQFSVDGNVFQLPMKFTDFEACGWTFEEDADEMLRASAYTLSQSFSFREGVEAYASVINFGINEAKLSDCYIGRISFDTYGIEDTSAEILLPGGVQFNVSTREDIEAAYGTPTDIYEGEYYTSLTYGDDSYNRVELQVDVETGLLSDIQITNFEMPEDFEEGEVDTSVPDIVTKYQTPTAVSDDLLDYTVEFAGDLYVLPAPVSAFVANGWKIDTDETEEAIPGHGSGRVQLSRDNQFFYSYAYNYSPNATTPENAFICDLGADNYDCKVSMKVSNGICIGMKEADLATALKSYDSKKEDQSSYIRYSVVDEECLTYHYEFIVRDGKIDSIDMQHDPGYDDFREAMGVN